MDTIAHVGGVPVEEVALQVMTGVGAAVFIVRAWYVSRRSR
jgi:hypothetical protein